MSAKMMLLFVLAIGVWLVAEAEKTFGKGEGLIVHYLFDEGEGVLIRDRSGKGHHGKIVGAVRWVKTPTGTALSFNGEDTYIDCAISDTLNMTKAGTIEVWFNMQSAQGVLVGFFTGSRWVDERLVIAFNTWEGRKGFIWCLADGETYQSGQMTIPI